MNGDRLLVWDLPVRLFHWSLATGFTAAICFAYLLGEDSTMFPYHAIIGFTLGLMVLLRVIWGLVGTRWARISGLALNPADLVDYAGKILTGKGKAYVGHNPATSFMMPLMFLMILGLGWTGYQMTTGSESGKDLHGLLANGMLAVIGAHLVGVFLHSVRQRDGIILSLLHGRKAGDPTQGIRGPAAVVGIAFMIAVTFFLGSMVTSYNPATQATKWPIVGTQLALGESDGGGNEGAGVKARENEEDDESDD